MSTTIGAPRAVRALLVVLLALPMLVASTAAASASTATSESELVQLINGERRAAGLKELPAQSQLTTVARDWSVQMASDGAISHRPDLATVIRGDWTALGENVGVGSSISSLHTAFMNSTGHRDNVLGNWDHVGVGVVSSDGRLWVTVNFSRGQIDGTASTSSGPTAPETTDVFSDVLVSGAHAPGILAIHEAGVTSGCAAGRFCPGQGVTRAQMASYLARALGLDTSRSATFPDVAADNVHAGAIAAVVEAGIAGGFEDGTYGPTRQVTRRQMAAFLTRAFELTAGSGGGFTDVVAGSDLDGLVGALADAGITSGCTATTYCPDDPVSRGQMATFLARALGLL